MQAGATAVAQLVVHRFYKCFMVLSCEMQLGNFLIAQQSPRALNFISGRPRLGKVVAKPSLWLFHRPLFLLTRVDSTIGRVGGELDQERSSHCKLLHTVAIVFSLSE